MFYLVFLQEEGCIQSIPLRANWIPTHVRFNNTIIGSHLLTPEQRKELESNKYWTALYDKDGPLKSISGKTFKGSYTTDGVTGCFTYQKQVPEVAGEDAHRILPKPPPSSNKRELEAGLSDENPDEEYETKLPAPRPLSALSVVTDVPVGEDPPPSSKPYMSPVDEAACKHDSQQLANVLCPFANHLPKDKLAKFNGNIVAGDGGRRDIWAFVPQNSKSTKHEQLTMTYTLQQRNQELKIKHHNKIRERVKTKAVCDAEDKLKKTPHAAIRVCTFWKYLRNGAEVYDVLSGFYCNSQTIHSESSHPLAVRKRAEALTAAASSSTTSSSSTSCGGASTLPTPALPTTYPLHCKLRLSSKINQPQSDERLGKEHRAKFGKDMVLMLGNWAPAKRRHHQPIRGKEWRTVFKRLGFTVILIDEYLTCQVCSNCWKRSLRKFSPALNPKAAQDGAEAQEEEEAPDS